MFLKNPGDQALRLFGVPSTLAYFALSVFLGPPQEANARRMQMEVVSKADVADCAFALFYF
jgi:hypothetical protein